MKTSEQLNEFATAFTLAQAAFKPASKTGINPYYKTDANPKGAPFSTLEDIHDASREALQANGLAVIQSPGFDNGRLVMTTRIIHKSGQWIEGAMSLKPKDDTPQATGAAITYGRRYHEGAMLGICSGEEDDGNDSSGKKPSKFLNEKTIFDGQQEQTALVIEAIKSINGTKDRAIALCKAYKERGATMKDVVADLKAITDVEIPF